MSSAEERQLIEILVKEKKKLEDKLALITNQLRVLIYKR